MQVREKTPPRINDELLKGVLEDNFPDFLRFLYPDADAIFDLEREIQFLDKELRKIAPNRKKKAGGRVADLLAKVFLRDGTEKRILVHTEIEGGRSRDFAFRMFQYYYRILERNKRHETDGDIPVEAIAFFTGDGKQPRPTEYGRQAIKTGMRFWYMTYHVFDHSEEQLLAMDNIFALVVLACQKSLLEGKVPDQELGRYRIAIARELLRRKYSRHRVLSLLSFLKDFLYVRDPELNRTFDDEVEQFSGGKTTMGVIQVLEERARKMGRQEGMELGRQEGMEKGRLEAQLVIAREMKHAAFPVDQIAMFTKIPVREIEKLS